MDSVTLTNLLLGVVGFCVVYILNGIRGEIKGVKLDVAELAKDLRGSIGDLYAKLGDHHAKIAEVTARCEIMHQQSRDRDDHR